RLLPIALLLALLYFSKPNYWVCAILCFYDPAVRLFRRGSSFWSRFRALVFCAGLALLSIGCIVVKSSFSNATIHNIAAPSNPLANRRTAESTELANRKSQTEKLFGHHVTLWDMLIKRQWIWLSCRSFFGDFGWMKFHLSITYYSIAILTFTGLV